MMSIPIFVLSVVEGQVDKLVYVFKLRALRLRCKVRTSAHIVPTFFGSAKYFDNKKATVQKCTVAKKTQDKPSTVYRRTSRRDGYAVEFLCTMQDHLKCLPFFEI